MSVAEYLKPYRAGALGDVWELPNALYEYVAILDAEVEALETEMQRQAIDHGASDPQAK